MLEQVQRMILDVGEVSNYGGAIGGFSFILLFLIMALVNVFALYFSAKLVVKEQSMLMALIVVIVAYAIAFGLAMVPAVGWLLVIIYLVAYIIVIKIVYCRKPEHGWLDAIVIWAIALFLSFIIALIITASITFLLIGLEASVNTNPYLTYLILLFAIAISIYILYWAVLKILSKPRQRQET